MHPVLLDLGEVELFGAALPLRVGSYGALLVLAMVLGWFLCRRLGARAWPGAPWGELYLAAATGGLLGAKLTNLIAFLPEIRAGRASWLAVFLGGGVWLGGVAGGAAAAAWVLRGSRLPLGIAFDALFTVAPLAHAVGRLGCLLGGCCYGLPTALPWAVVYSDPLAAALHGTPLGLPLHPYPVYESLVELANFGLCLALLRRRPAPGTVAATWGLLYGAERFLLEALRGDPRGAFAGLSTSRWLALALAAGAAFLLLRSRRAVARRAATSR